MENEFSVFQQKNVWCDNENNMNMSEVSNVKQCGYSRGGGGDYGMWQAKPRIQCRKLYRVKALAKWMHVSLNASQWSWWPPLHIPHSRACCLAQQSIPGVSSQIASGGGLKQRSFTGMSAWDLCWLGFRLTHCGVFFFFFLSGGIVFVLIKQAACEKKRKSISLAGDWPRPWQRRSSGLIEREIVCLHLGMQNLTGIYNLIRLSEYTLWLSFTMGDVTSLWFTC